MSHRFIPDPASPSVREINPEHTAAIKRWTSEIKKLSAGTVVTVAETACLATGCPVVKTVVAVFDERGTPTWKSTRPRVAVTKLMLRQTLATPPRVSQSTPKNR